MGRRDGNQIVYREAGGNIACLSVLVELQPLTATISWFTPQKIFSIANAGIRNFQRNNLMLFLLHSSFQCYSKVSTV